MSQSRSDEWESVSEESSQGDETNADAGPSRDVPDTDTEAAELSFSKKSPEQVEHDATTSRSRTSSLSSGLRRLSLSQSTILPPQPTPPAPQTSASPERSAHDTQHERPRSPKPSLPDSHDTHSSTQKRGPGIPRNPVADTWRDDAYQKKEAGKGKMVAVGKQQDRWRCEYCGNLNERGGASVARNDGAGVGPSDASPHATRRPVSVPGSNPPGVAPNEHVLCAGCGERMFFELARYDPRELAEDGVRWSAVEEPHQAKALMKEVAKGVPLRRGQERWRGDAERHREEERRRSGEGGGGGSVEEGEPAGEERQDEARDTNAQVEDEDDGREDTE